MRSLRGLTGIVAATALVVAAQVGAASQITTTNSYTVGSRDVPGATTDIVLTRGKSVTVTATGTVCPGTGFCVSPDGYPSDTVRSTIGSFVLPGAPAFGLVARVGTGPWVQVGSGPTTLTGSGVLVFAVNDDLFVDNAGSFTATVSYEYTCWPGWGHGDKNHEHCGPPGLVGKNTTGGQSSGKGKGQTNGQGNGQATGQGNGQGNGKGNGQPDGQANGRGNGQANGQDGQGNGQADGQGNGQANGQGNGNTVAKGKG